MHETKWESRRFGGTPPPCDVAPGRRLWGTGGRTANEMFTGLCESLADGGQSPGAGRASAQACAGKAESPEYKAASAATQDDAQGGWSVWFFHRPLDFAPRRRAHRAYLWSSLSPRPCVESVARGRMELSETRAASPRARRGGHREVADGALAPYKKTPAEPAEAWSFSMKAASCSSRWSDEPGHRGARRRSFANGIAAIDSRPSAQSPLPRTVDDMVCTGLSTDTISVAEKSFTFFRDCCDICRRDSRSFGTADNRTARSWSRTGLNDGGGLSPSSCHPMHRILTRWRRSGAIPNMGTWRTMLPTAFRTLNNPSSPPWAEPKVKGDYYPRSSRRQD